MKKIVFLIFLFCLSVSFASPVLKISVESKNNILEISNVKLIEGEETINEERMPLELKLINSLGETINSKKFYINCDLLASISINSQFDVSTIKNDSCSKEIFLGYNSTATKLVLFEENKELDSFDLRLLCIENGVCDENESEWSCPNDCLKGEPDLVCNPILDGHCDLDCAQGVDLDCILEENDAQKITSKKEQSTIPQPTESITKEPDSALNPIFFVLPIVFVLAIIVLIGLFFVMKKQIGEEN